MLNSFSKAGFAVRRVDRTIARSLTSSAMAIIYLQALPIAWAEREMIQPVWFWLTAGLVALIQLSQVVVAWLGRSVVPLYLAMHLSVLAAILIWPLILVDGNPEHAMPWMWWALAIAGLNSFGAFKPLPALVATAVLHSVWILQVITNAFGHRPLWVAVQDTLLSFFFSTLLGMLLVGLRQTTAKVDDELARRAVLAAEAATARAKEAARERMSAIVHDSVLTALLLGANAHTESDRQAAARVAQNSIKRLSTDDLQKGPVSLTSRTVFAALAEASRQHADDLSVHVDELAILDMPGEVAEALTEATLQAIINSVRHAGTVRKRELRLSSTENRIKIVVKDDGRGFRESRVSRTRLGIRYSIRERVSKVGGRVAIQSEPGAGCTIALTWAAPQKTASQTAGDH